VNTLFPLEQQLPPGFKYFPEFISSEEEKQLILTVQELSLHPFMFHGFEAKRKVSSFGYDYSFTQKILTKGLEIPVQFSPLIQKVGTAAGLLPNKFVELLVTEYPPGAVINWHRDAPPFGLVAGISLNNDCIFKLRPQDKKLQVRANVISLPVRRRSLYIMDGASRSEWQHSILPVKSLRYSITLRTLK
jgi:alkylated DNA repair dioxygenase AlkB